jgi:hypothetical protein
MEVTGQVATGGLGIGEMVMLTEPHLPRVSMPMMSPGLKRKPHG